jgi:hypothetical protein
MKKNLFILTEEEKNRILNLHISATKSQYLSEQDATTPASTTPESPTPTDTNQTPENKNQILTFNDRDYIYKKEGDKYFFRLQRNPASAKAQEFKKSGRFLDWTEAKGGSLDAIKKLNFQPENLTTKKPTQIQTNTTPQTDLTAKTTTGTTVGGGGEQQIINPMEDAKKSLPKIDTLDAVKSREVIAWSKTPQGQYVLKTPADQREAALDNLDRIRGDKETRRLKKEIRQALGMAADTLAGRVGSAIKGGVQGAKQGFRQQTT